MVVTMKEVGIIMSGNHPKLILEGTKTMTRRVIKPQPLEDMVFKRKDPCIVWNVRGRDGMVFGDYVGFAKNAVTCCPYGQVGDLLWVREAWATYGSYDRCKPSQLLHQFDIFQQSEPRIFYRADGGRDDRFKWRPSIFMPRWASRLTLEITGVRVERLIEITLRDIYAEGIDNNPFTHWHSHHRKFVELWNSLNAKRGYSWETNPFCWVIEFRRI